METQEKSGRSNAITSYGEMTSLVDEGKAVDIVCLDTSKTFDCFL